MQYLEIMICYGELLIKGKNCMCFINKFCNNILDVLFIYF